MQETDRYDHTDSDPALPYIEYPTIGIELRPILDALKYELPRRKLVFGPELRRGTNVHIPTLQQRFMIKPIGNFLLIKIRKKYKVPIELDERGALSPRIIKVLCNHINRLNINNPIRGPLSKL